MYAVIKNLMNGDKQNALKEFAQCGAVILLIMETIEKEI